MGLRKALKMQQAKALTLASTVATQARKIGTAATQGIQAQTAKEILAERKRAAKSVKKALLKEKAALKMAHAFKKQAHRERRKRLHAVKLAQVTVAKTETLTHKTLSNLAAKEKAVEADEAPEGDCGGSGDGQCGGTVEDACGEGQGEVG